jgi:hypothetical protein
MLARSPDRVVVQPDALSSSRLKFLCDDLPGEAETHDSERRAGLPTGPRNLASSGHPSAASRPAARGLGRPARSPATTARCPALKMLMRQGAPPARPSDGASAILDSDRCPVRPGTYQEDGEK